MDSDALVSLYYDTNNSGQNGTLIVEGISEDSGVNSYQWNISQVGEEGNYYVYAVISDGVNDPVIRYSAGPVTVDAGQAVDDLIALIESFDLHRGTENSLTAKAGAALASLAKGKDKTAINQLEALIHAAEAQSGKKIPAAKAAMLIEKTRSIIGMLR